MIKKYIKFFIFACICFIIADIFVNADTYPTSYSDIQKYYDNRGSSLVDVGATWNSSLQAYLSNNITTVSNSYGAVIIFNSPIPIIQNHTYTISISFPQRNNIALSSKPGLSIGSSIDDASYKYRVSTYGATTQYRNVVNNSTLQYVFKASSNSAYILIPWTTISTITQDYNISQVIIDDLGDSGVSETTINNSLNNQTNIINNSIQSSTNNIQSSIHTTEENIINNQNENQEKTNELLGNCHKNLINLNNVNTSDSNSGYRYPVSLTAGKTYTIMSYDNLFNFKIGESRWSHTDNESNSSSQRYTFTYTPNSNNSSHYLMVYYQQPPGANLSTHLLVLVEGNYNGPFINYNEQSCSSKLDDTNQAINDVNNSLNDDDTTGATDKASDFFSSFSTDTFGLTSIITAPLNLIQSLTSSSCSDLHIPLPYLDNKYIDLPCMSSIYQSTFGSFFTMYQTVTFGIIAYWVCVRVFNKVKDFKNPEHDEIEVLDL